MQDLDVGVGRRHPCSPIWTGSREAESFPVLQVLILQLWSDQESKKPFRPNKPICSSASTVSTPTPRVSQTRRQRQRTSQERLSPKQSSFHEVEQTHSQVKSENSLSSKPLRFWQLWRKFLHLCECKNNWSYIFTFNNQEFILIVKNTFLPFICTFSKIIVVRLLSRIILILSLKKFKLLKILSKHLSVFIQKD